MKKLMKKQGGFTLIEIIVVLIILGILAAIALPSLFSNVTKSRAAEALATMDSYKPAILACLGTHPGDEVDCNTGGANAVTLTSSTNFDYALADAANNTTAWTLTATAKAGGATIKINGAGTACVVDAAGPFAGVC